MQAAGSQNSRHRHGPDSRLGLCATLIRDAAGGEPASLGQKTAEEDARTQMNGVK